MRGQYGISDVPGKHLNLLSISCIEHTIHLMASHFVSALNISRLRDTQKWIHVAVDEAPGTSDREDLEDEEDNFDVDTNMEVEALRDDEDAMREASVTDFDAGDVIGKLMAFITQLRSCSEGVQNYLMELSVLNGCVPWHIKLWVQTCWGSLSDCF